MSDDTLLLGPAPRPQTSEALTTALRTAVTGILPREVSGIDHATIAARLDGSTIAELIIDLTGVSVPTLSDDLLDISLISTETRSATPTTIAVTTVSAAPLTVAGARVTLQGQVRDLPAVWVETTQGQAGLQFPEPTDASKPVTGEGEASVDKGELQRAALTIGQGFARDMGVTLDDLKLDFQAVSPTALKFFADAKVKKGFIGASAVVNGNATLDDAMNVTLSNLQVGSKNPVINALLGALKGRIDRLNGRTIRINDKLPGGVKLTHAEFEITDKVTIKGRIG